MNKINQRTNTLSYNSLKTVLFSLAIIAVCTSLQFTSCKKNNPDVQAGYTLKVTKTGQGTETATWAGGSATDAELATGVKVPGYTGITLTATPDPTIPNLVVEWGKQIDPQDTKVTLYENKSIDISFIVDNTGFIFNEDATSATLIAYTGTATYVGIPETYNGKPVTTIGTGTSHVIIDGNIWFPLFNNFTSSIKSVTIPNSVTTIKENTFGSCTNLTTLNIGKQVNNISVSAFTGCSKLSTINIDPANTNIILIDGVLYNSTKTQIIFLPYTITDYRIPNIVTDYNFAGNKFLKTITISGGSCSIPYYTFSGCGNLTTVNLPSSIRHINGRAFSECSNLINITLPNGLEQIDSDVFNSCSSLTNMNIPNSVTYISPYTFSNCSGIKNYTVDAGNTIYFATDVVLFEKRPLPSTKNTLYYYPAGKSGNSYIIRNDVEYINARAFSLCTNLTSITISNGVKNIGTFAFSDCTGLTNITLPSSITYIGYNAFFKCSNLSNVRIEATTLPDNSSGIMFTLTSDNLKISVPTASVNAYKTAGGWSNSDLINKIVDGGF